MILTVHGPVARALPLALVAAIAQGVDAAPVLRSAEVTVTMTAPVACDVAMALVVDGAASPLDHRLEADQRVRVTDVEVDGAERVGDVQTIGRTQSLTLAPRTSAYTLRYRVQQADDRRGRCPLWLPTAPADGVSRNVRIQVQLPAGTASGSSLPAFTWNGTHGTTTLGHLPAFVLLPYATAGEAQAWDVSAVMDAMAIGVFVVATAIWLRRRRTR